MKKASSKQSVQSCGKKPEPKNCDKNVVQRPCKEKTCTNDLLICKHHVSKTSLIELAPCKDHFGQKKICYEMKEIRNKIDAKRVETGKLDRDISVVYHREDRDIRRSKLYYQKKVKKRCATLDKFIKCIKLRVTPCQLETNDQLREKYLKTVHEYENPDIEAFDPMIKCRQSFVQIGELPGESGLKPASLTPSLEVCYLQPKQELKARRAKSGIFLNEATLCKDTTIPFFTYNPRILQCEMEGKDVYNICETPQKEKYVKIQDDDDDYAFDPDCCCNLFKVDKPDINDCIYYKPYIYAIPDFCDLKRTFKIIARQFGTKASPAKDNIINFRQPRAIADIFYAFMYTYLLNPCGWRPKLIDKILEGGKKLYDWSVKFNYFSQMDFDILPEIKEKNCTIKYKMIIKIKSSEYPNILKLLTKEFETHQHMVFRSGCLYLLLFKRCANSFCIFDPNGRNWDGIRDLECGKAALLMMKTIEHVCHVILNLSCLPRDCQFEYELYEMHLINFGYIAKPITWDPIYSKKYWVVVNQKYALIPGTIGLENPRCCNDVNASMMISYISILYGHIDPARHWKRITIDLLIMIGMLYFKKYLIALNITTLNIKQLPGILVIGVYRGIMNMAPFFSTGQINRDCIYFKNSTLYQSMLHCFKHYQSCILQIDNNVNMAIFRDNDFWYVFDPFGRKPNGLVMCGDNSSGYGVLQMHLTFDSMMYMIFRNCLDIYIIGNYMVHAINIDAVNLMCNNRFIQDENGLRTLLQVIYPVDCDRPPFDCDDLIKKYPIELSCVPPWCLSRTSCAPLQRVCSEKSFLDFEQKYLIKKPKPSYSMHSLLPKDKLCGFDGKDIADYIVKYLVCKIMQDIIQKEEGHWMDYAKAKKVLLKSDEGYLRQLKQRIKRGQDYDNINELLIKKPLPLPAPPTLSEELLLQSNYYELPDGTFLIAGKYKFNYYEDNDQLLAVISALLSLVYYSKYKISTWSTSVVDYLINSAKDIKKKIRNNILNLILKDKVPKIEMGSSCFQIYIKKIETCEYETLKDFLICALAHNNRVLVVMNTFTCAVFKRYNFFYLFVGYPNDFFGYRTYKPGFAVVMRFKCIFGLLHRINSNRFVKDPHQPVVLVQIDAKDLYKDRERFRYRTPSQDFKMMQGILDEKHKVECSTKDKLKFVDAEILREKARIKKFQDEKKAAKKTKPIKSSKMAEEMEMCEYEDWEMEDICEGDWKHPSRTPLGETDTYYRDKPCEIVETGYKLRKEDCHFKIQGTTSLENRMDGSMDKMRVCFISSIFSIIHLVMEPIYKWDTIRVDKIIESAQRVAKKMNSYDLICEYVFNGMAVEDYKFNVNVSALPLRQNWCFADFMKAEKGKHCKYLLIQTANTTYGYYRDQYFHLFDSYPSMERNEAAEADDDIVSKKRCPIMTEYSDRNSASWVLFNYLDEMIKYIDERALSPAWKKEFNIYIVEVIKFTRIPKRDLTFIHEKIIEDGKCKITTDINNLCSEDICWLEIQPLVIPWNRETKITLTKVKRDSLEVKQGSFEIEIPEELYSLWGTKHPSNCVFQKQKGKQYLAVNVIACCMVHAYRLTEWNPRVVDCCVLNGDKYYKESVASIKRKEYEMSLEDLNPSYKLEFLQFTIHIESILYGYLYNRRKEEFNLSRGFTYFFRYFKYGVIQCMGKSLAFGKANQGYFMFDCQSYGPPVFKADDGVAYIFRCTSLQRLLHCIILTFNLPYYNMTFNLHAVDINVVKV